MQSGGPVIVGMNPVTAINGSLPDVADYIYGAESTEKQNFISSVLPQIFSINQTILDFEQNGVQK
jgi:hypothetical protein